jgi:hypothetical protein
MLVLSSLLTVSKLFMAVIAMVFVFIEKLTRILPDGAALAFAH